MSGLMERPLVGTPAELTREAALLRASGRLVAATEPRQLRDGRYEVTVTLQHRPRRRRARPGVVAVMVAVATVATAATGYVLYLVTAAAVAAALRALAGVLVAVAVLTPAWWLLGRVGVCCPGLHCPGCRHR